MKVTNLMVGDFVNVNDLPLRVGAIRQDELGFFDNDYKIYWCSDDEFDRIDPIPLTEYILVKNGWDFRDRQYAIECKEDERGIVELSRDKDGYYWSINWDEYQIIRIHYVHELQHILRLCGIGKEIEL